MANPEDKPRADDIALIGIGCIFPGAEGPDQFWRSICAKESQIRQAPPEWCAERYLGSQTTTRITTERGGYLGDLYRFDPVEIGVMPNSVDGSEPDQFLALKVAGRALADAGYGAGGYDPVTAGVVLGHSTYLHRGNANIVQHGVVVDQTVSLIHELLPDAPPEAFERLRSVLLANLPAFRAETVPGFVPNVMTGRIANRFDLRGPNYLVDAACASSLLAVKQAVEELRRGTSDLMIAGGVNASTPAEVSMVFTQLDALSPQSQVRPFDAAADGTLLGEGLGMVVLKRLKDAIRDGDRVYAVVKGVGHSSDGKGSGLLAPRLEGEVLAIRRGLEDAGVAPETISLLEAHGTGIPLGDRTEIAALRMTFGERDADLPRIALGAIKSMIGHCIPAAGIAGLIKAALALHHRVLPPTICGDVNQGLGLDTTKFYINTETRPWVSPRGTPRRAGIDAFGFGGINAHAVLEEAPEPDAGVRPAYLAAELVVLAADTTEALVEAIDELQQQLASGLAREPLAAVAVALAARHADRGPVRLAIVAESIDDLSGKLDTARKHYSNGRSQFQARSGVYGSDRARDGKLAFVFPGEGLQYQGMIGDIVEAFPEARRWFDFWDGLYGEARGFRPSECVFPPPTGLTSAAKEKLREALFGLEMGSESAFIASQALLAVVRRLGLRPDAVVGHSSGEHAALCAAGVLGEVGWDELEGRIREMNRLYRAMEQASTTPGGALLTIGAASRERIFALAAEADVHIALDNCHQQTVLYGARSTLDEIASRLGREGALCAFLPFDRPYHTPLFAPVAAMVETIYRNLDFKPPMTAIYSCATAAPMPTAPDEIVSLVANQWQSRVRFTETIERMYQDGVRTFVEIGPSANLTGFIDNILQGKDVLSVALDSRRRSSLGQLLHALGRLWTAGVRLDIDKLYDGRAIKPADLTGSQPARSKERLFPNTLPFIRLSQDERAELRAAFFPSAERVAPHREAGDAPPSMSVPGEPPLPQRRDVLALQYNGDAPEQRSTGTDNGHQPAEAATAMMDHFALMQQFLHTQSAVMGSLLVDTADSSAASYPFLHRIIAHDGERLIAECDLDVGCDAFLRQHVLYASEVSDLDPDLTGLSVVPLAVSLEMLAEAAAKLAGDLVPISLEQVRAHNWVALDEGSRTVTLEAVRWPGAEGPVRVSAAIRDGGGAPLVEAVVVLAEAPRAAARSQVPPLRNPQQPLWRDEDLYRTGMFHGPLFQSVGSLIAWDETGLDARLLDTPLNGFFAPDEEPVLVLNPVLLDAIGHVTAFWIAQQRGTDFSSFPSRIDAIELFDASRKDTGGVVLSGRLAFDSSNSGPAYLIGEFTAHDPNGAMLFRATGWRDRFFEVPHAFSVARWQPREHFYGHEISRLFAELPDEAVVWRVPALPAGFLDDAGGIWRRVLAHTVLSAEERQQWSSRAGNTRRADEWLLGRIAIKEAARTWFMSRLGVLILPADLVVRYRNEGGPYISADGLDALGEVPEVSVAHVGGEAVAIAAPAGMVVGIDMEKLGRVNARDLMAGGFTEQERTMLGNAADETSLLQAWCAKEAAAKSLGVGLNGRPTSFVVQEMGARGPVRVSAPGDIVVEVAMAAREQFVLAIAYR